MLSFYTEHFKGLKNRQSESKSECERERERFFSWLPGFGLMRDDEVSLHP